MLSSSKGDAWETNEFRRNMATIYLQIHFSDLDGCNIHLKNSGWNIALQWKNVLILIATSGRSKCEMSRCCTHTLQASVNRDSWCIDQWTIGRMCSVKTHAYWKRPWPISVSLSMCEPGSSVFSLSEPQDGHYENRSVIRLGRIFVHRFPGACPASRTVDTGLLSKR